MNIALVDNGQVTAVGDYRALFPQTSFPPSGPSDEFLAANGAMKVNVWLPYDQMTEQLSACAPYIQNGWVYTVEVVALTPEQIAARNEAQASSVRSERDQLLTNCDWTQLPDSPVDPLPWRTYRQELRDVPEQSGFPWAVVWPLAPGALPPHLNSQ